ncbi:hypothetical protein [Parafrankia irregularis]|uniref:hypothetical protein n=1 Tax=Parafrankia irregularis TaxID=795642 RepID=UPI001A97B270|nr:hypothetical protein [Parafrankia irregularis]
MTTEMLLRYLLRDPHRSFSDHELARRHGRPTTTTLAWLEAAGWLISSYDTEPTSGDVKPGLDQQPRQPRRMYRLTGHGTTAARAALAPAPPGERFVTGFVGMVTGFLLGLGAHHIGAGALATAVLLGVPCGVASGFGGRQVRSRTGIGSGCCLGGTLGVVIAANATDKGAGWLDSTVIRSGAVAAVVGIVVFALTAYATAVARFLREDLAAREGSTKAREPSPRSQQTSPPMPPPGEPDILERH